jgi:hypothetical protein
VGLWKADTYVKSWLIQHRSAADTRIRLAAPTLAADLVRPNPIWDLF